MHLCQCTFYKCKDSTTPDGRQGCLLDARIFKKHEKAETLTQLHKNASAAQTQALEKHDVELAQAVDSMTLSDLVSHPAVAQPVLPSTGTDSPFNRTKRLLARLEEIEGGLNDIEGNISTIGDAPAHTDDGTLSETLIALGNIK
ncbi:hypothetical protein DXG01_011580, partial [Tephrocybe rancida]